MPADPMASPTVPSRQARPTLSEMMTAISLGVMRVEAGLQPLGARLRIARQEEDAPAVIFGREIRLVDAGIRHYEAVMGLDDDHARLDADDLDGFAQDRLDKARILARHLGELAGARRRRERSEIEEAILGLGDDFLCDDQYVEAARRERRPIERRDQQRCEIVAGSDEREYPARR